MCIYSNKLRSPRSSKISYSSLPLTSKLFQLTFLTCALALAGCGGGDGTDVIAPTPDLGPEKPGTGGGNNGGDQAVEEIKIVEGALFNAEDNVINSVSLEGAYYKIKVVDKTNNPLVNAKVIFGIDAEGVNLFQTTSGSFLTDAKGVAQIFLKPSSAEVFGGYTVSAIATYDQKSAKTSTDFSVQATKISLSEITVGSNRLVSGGQTPITLKVTNEKGDALSGILVDLNSSCGQIQEQVTSDSEGMVEAVFKAINLDTRLCSGNVSISASTGTGNPTRITSVSVIEPKANSIVFTSDPFTLGAQNSGSSATGRVEFTVYSDNIPLANSDVILSLYRAPFDLTFGELGNRADLTTTTDQNGKVSVQIYPGETLGAVQIKATLVGNPNINALSTGISIAISRVTQTGLSLSWEKNVLDWSYDGDTTRINARMADRNGNKVPDGTVISFTAEGGKIESSCETVDGNCSVEFSTQNPRPGDGRVSILAIAEGEKDYIDMNGNNTWDEGTDVLVHNIGDTFRDDNENGIFDLGEFNYPSIKSTESNQVCKNNINQFINLKFPSLSDLKKRQYESRYINEFVSPNKANTCNTGLDTVVRYQGITLLSNGNDARFTVGSLDQGGNFTVRPSQDIFSSDTLISFRVNSGGFYDLSPMPSGTTISGSATDNTDTSAPVNINVSPAGQANRYNIMFSGAKPGNILEFILDEQTYSAIDNGNGIYVFEGLARNTAPTADDIEIVSEEGSCSAEMYSGVGKVPANVATGSPGDNLGTFTTFKLKDCQAKDELKVTATAPNGNVTSYTYTIR